MRNFTENKYSHRDTEDTEKEKPNLNFSVRSVSLWQNKIVRIDSKKLVAAAAQARLGSVSPYSNFKVGVALLTKSGDMIGGANVESASYGLTCCSERVALFKALTDGKKNLS